MIREYGLVARHPTDTKESLEQRIRDSIKENGHRLIRVEYPDLSHLGIRLAVYAVAEDDE